MIQFKPTIEVPIVKDVEEDYDVIWIMFAEGNLSEPIACLHDTEMRLAAIAWLKLHPEAAKKITKMDWFGKKN
jgi:hypothetical protein